MIRKISLLFLALATCLMMFSGCSSTSSKKIHIKFYNYEDAIGLKDFKPIVDEYSKTHPDVAIDFINMTYDKLNAALASGDPPDLFYLQGNLFLYYFAQGAIEPLNDYIANDKDFDFQKYPESIRNAVSYKGQICLLPKGCHTYVLFFNKEIFDSEGVPYPNDSWTVEDMIAAGKKLTKDVDGDGRIDRFGFNGYAWYDLFGFLQSYGGGILSPDGTKVIVNSEATLEGLQMAQDLLYKYKICPGGGNAAGSDINSQQATDPFRSGKIAMKIDGYFAVNGLRVNSPNLNFDVALPPKGPKGRGSHLEFTAYVMSSKSTHKKEAWDFMKLMAGAFGTRIFTAAGKDLPAYQDEEAVKLLYAPNKRPEHVSAFIEALKFAFLNRYLTTQVVQPFGDQWDLIRINKKDVRQAMNEASERIKTALADFRKRLGETK